MLEGVGEIAYWGSAGSPTPEFSPRLHVVEPEEQLRKLELCIPPPRTHNREKATGKSRSGLFGRGAEANLFGG